MASPYRVAQVPATARRMAAIAVPASSSHERRDDGSRSPRSTRRYYCAVITPLRRVLVAGGLAAIAVAGTLAQQPAESPERQFLSRVRRLTVEGRRAGEGYWAPDGRSLVFQSEREPGN